MKRIFVKLGALISIILLLTSMFSCSSTPTALSIAPRHTEATVYQMRFIELLNNSGLTAQSHRDSQWATVFNTAKDNVSIQTDKGQMEVFFFDEGISAAERVSVTEIQRAGRYTYTINQVVGDPSSGKYQVKQREIEGPAPMYFIIKKNIVVLTFKSDTRDLVEKALSNTR